MKKIILAGHTGLQKATAAVGLRESLQQEIPEWDRITVVDVEQCVVETGGGQVALFAGVVSNREQRRRWMAGWQRALEKIDEERPRCAILTCHLVLASRCHRSCPIDLASIAEWQPDFIFTLIDDVYSVKRRIQLKEFPFSVAQLYEWRTLELMMADQAASISSAEGRTVESLLLPVKHPARMAASLIARQGKPRAYVSYTIGKTRTQAEDVSEINDFRCWLHKTMPTFDPVTIEELPLLKMGTQEDQMLSFHPLMHPNGSPKAQGDKRWDCRLDDAEWQPLVWEPEEARDAAGNSVPFFPVTFADAEFEELSYSIKGQAGDIISDHVTERDLRFVDQADMVVCYRPFWKGTSPSTGVGREIVHANETGKPVYAFVGNDPAAQPSLRPYITQQFTDLGRFKAFLQRKADEDLPHARPVYY